jgi:hypothetical protein
MIRTWLAFAILLFGPAAAASSAPMDEVEGETQAELRAHNDLHYPWLADVAEHLSRSRNPRHLMVAARLATPFWFQKDVELSPEVRAALDARVRLDPAALVEDALRLGATDPLLWWIAANDCPAPPTRCDRSAAVAQLQSLAPSNAAVWTLSDRGRRPEDDGAVDAARDAQDDLHLERIADASRFDIYSGEMLRSYIDAFSQLPLPPRASATDTQFDAPPSDDVVRGMLALGYAMAEALPGLGYFSGLCDEKAISRLGDARRERCLAAMRTAARDADSILVERIVLRTQLRLLPDGAERDAAQRASIRSAWQMESWIALQRREDPTDTRIDTQFTEETLALWRAPGATELGVIHQQLGAAGIPLEPPANWHPSQPFDPQTATEAD